MTTKHPAVEALEAVREDVCGLLCPSTKKTGEEWTHVPKCEAITAALATEEESVHVHRSLALVERSLKSREGYEAVCLQTGGSAPELVQGILDGIGGLYAALGEPAELEFPEYGAVTLTMSDHGDVLIFQVDTIPEEAKLLAQGDCVGDAWRRMITKAQEPKE